MWRFFNGRRDPRPRARAGGSACPILARAAQHDPSLVLLPQFRKISEGRRSTVTKYETIGKYVSRFGRLHSRFRFGNGHAFLTRRATAGLKSLRDGRRRRLPQGHRQRERGSALLIVFLFAAFVAIALLMELPVVYTEARREKEQLLMDRAQEYKQGIKVFYHRFRTYPNDLKQLEDTNRIRFIRRRFKDPITNSAEWRLIHVGPTGIPIDSKVTPSPSQNPKDAKNSSSSIFDQSSSAPQAQNQQAASVSFSVTPVPETDQAKVTDSQSNAGPADSTPNMPVAEADPTQPQQGTPANPTEGAQQKPDAAKANAESTQEVTDTSEDGEPDPPQTNPYEPAGQLNEPQPSSNQAASAKPARRQQEPGAANPAEGQPGQESNAVSGTGGSMASTGLGNQSGQAQGLGNNTRGFGPDGARGSMIGGVATKGSGKTIKVYQDQTDLEKWEFIYKPGEETTGIQQGNPQNPNQQNRNRINNSDSSSQPPRP